MKRSNLYFILFLFYMSCQSQNHDYKVIYLSNNDIQTIHYFHPDDAEYARVYGSSVKNDSLTFSKKKNDLIVKEFKYNDEQKRRIATGNIKYVNYYGKLSDIVASENAFSMDEVPFNHFNFLNKDLEIERMVKENCKYTNDGYNDCDFRLPKSSELPYWPDNSVITSARIKMKENRLDEIEFQAKHFDTPFNYKRNYYYNKNTVEKIITSVKDSTSVESYENKFIIIKGKK